MPDKNETALKFFADNFNCTQSVIGAFCEELGLDKEHAFKIAGGFGGGLRCGEVCGAVSGAVMALGLKYGHHIEGDMDRKRKCYAKSREYMDRYEKEFGSYMCRDLLGYDMKDEGARERNKDKHLTVCPPIITNAVKLLEEILADE